ncbi:hypothetical protein [Shimia thalassica]|uniref:hypothetical protein n=1 Tax=Shimia thalassica TaxID=1715693 RepID=UPI0026E43F16|nr:hypothetical protein [Shimia thalassica]MDO6797957.1 hypothetical protein [Shimia thalassica]
MGNSASRGLTAEWPIALIWMSFLLMTLIGSSLKPEVIGATSSLVVLAAIFGVMLLAVFESCTMPNASPRFLANRLGR